MKPNEWEVIILKPTAVFQAFIAAQCPDIEAPDLNVLKTDCTAYIIPKQECDEEVLNVIEAHFKEMFHHELSRWLGDNVEHDIKGSFLDFLCCFKFELHNQFVLLEDSIQLGKQLFCVRPRAVLLKWMKSVVEDQQDLSDVLERMSVSDLAENATVVIKNFSNPHEVKGFLRDHYSSIFEAEMCRMSDDMEQWPKIDSYQDFSRYFATDIHTKVVHLN